MPTSFLPWVARHSSPILQIALLTLIVLLAALSGSEPLKTTLTEMLIRVTLVVGLYIFIGTSGVFSFGHAAFVCIGAYALAWATVDPSWKEIMLTGLPTILRGHQYSFAVGMILSALVPAIVALGIGAAIMRLSDIAAAIATFAFLIIVNRTYSGLDTVTAGVSSIIGIPTVVDIWTALIFAIIAIVVAYAFQRSRYGLMLKGTRDDEIAARASGVNVLRLRLIAFVLSAAVVGAGGGLFAQFLGILTVDAFYLNMTFTLLAMLVVGGVGSLAGATVGVVSVTVMIEAMRFLERGIVFDGEKLQIPAGSQELGLGVLMALVLIFRPTGLTHSRELTLARWWLRRRQSALPN
jgi:branched-chain amino acid transport system permease protein